MAEANDKMAEINNSWNMIVQLAHAHQNSLETIVQNDWVSILHEIFGYRKLYREIDEQRQLYIGSYERVIPDIVVSKDGKDLFLVELKCYNLPKQDRYVEQLKSYMKQLDLEIGVLVCNKLYLVCRDTDGGYPYIEIPFEEDNAYGELFVESFSRKDFNTDFIKDFILENKKRHNEVAAVRAALEEICADGEGFLKNILAEKYPQSAIDEAFIDLDVVIHIKNKTFVVVDPPTWPPRDPRPYWKRDPNEPHNTLTKSEAIEMFNRRGYNLKPQHTTFASKNRTQDNYWANTPFRLLHQELYLILNDWINKKLYLFKIPANAISENELRPRRGQPEKIDLEICYNDPTFTDSRSKYRFEKFKIDEISY